MVVLKRLGTRSVTNHEDMMTGLKLAFDHEYEVVDLEAAALTTRDQASVFSRSDVLIAPHGSGLSNAIFLQEGSTVVELLPWEYPNLTFYVALSWFPVRHALFLVREANAYSGMVVDTKALVNRLYHYLERKEKALEINFGWEFKQ